MSFHYVLRPVCIDWYYLAFWGAASSYKCALNGMFSLFYYSANLGMNSGSGLWVRIKSLLCLLFKSQVEQHLFEKKKKSNAKQCQINSPVREVSSSPLWRLHHGSPLFFKCCYQQAVTYREWIEKYLKGLICANKIFLLQRGYFRAHLLLCQSVMSLSVLRN